MWLPRVEGGGGGVQTWNGGIVGTEPLATVELHGWLLVAISWSVLTRHFLQ